MFEYKDDFLMGPKTAIENSECGARLCSASHAADDQLSELAKIVGGDSTNPKSDSAGITLIDDAPSLEFDLEGEISKAFETAEPELADEPPVSNASAIDTALSPEAIPVPETGMDFSDMIGDELDRALAEEVAVDVTLNESVAEQSVDAYEQELNNLAEGGIHQPMASPPAPPIPEAAAQPWSEPQIMETPSIPVATDIVVEAVAQPEFSPPQMEDFEAAAQDFSDPAAEIHTSTESVVATVVESEVAIGEQHIESVIGGAAALGVAATTQKLEQVRVDPVAKIDADYSGEFATSFDESSVSIPAPHIHDAPIRSVRSGRGVAVAIVAVALFSGAAAFGWNAMEGDSGPAPTILASSDPVKVKPKDAGGKVVPNQDLAVFKSVDGSEKSVPKQKRLKDKTEKPIVVAAKTPAPKTDSRIAGTDSSTTGGLILKPRRVRTVVVRPDGTIISKSTPKLNSPTSGVDVVEPTLSLDTKVVKVSALAPELPKVEPAAAPKAVETPVKIAKLQPAPVKINPVVATPEPKKVEKPAVETVEKAASLAPVVTNVPSPYSVQISSQRSAAAAQQTYKTLSKRYASVLDGKGVNIQKAVIKGKGTYYRVRIPAPTRSAANKICSSLKAKGGACFVTR